MSLDQITEAKFHEWCEQIANLEEILRNLSPELSRHYDVAAIRSELLPTMRKVARDLRRSNG